MEESGDVPDEQNPVDIIELLSFLSESHSSSSVHPPLETKVNESTNEELQNLILKHCNEFQSNENISINEQSQIETNNVNTLDNRQALREMVCAQSSCSVAPQSNNATSNSNQSLFEAIALNENLLYEVNSLFEKVCKNEPDAGFLKYSDLDDITDLFSIPLVHDPSSVTSHIGLLEGSGANFMDVDVSMQHSQNKVNERCLFYFKINFTRSK